MTATICYTCKKQNDPNAKLYSATFYGEQQFICPDCAEGIHNGLEILTGLGVSGEFLGTCPDNQGSK